MRFLLLLGLVSANFQEAADRIVLSILGEGFSETWSPATVDAMMERKLDQLQSAYLTASGEDTSEIYEDAKERIRAVYQELKNMAHGDDVSVSSIISFGDDIEIVDE